MDRESEHSAEIISRETALAAGLKRYRTGKPCRKGHYAERHTCNLVCVECHRNHMKHPDRLAYNRAWFKENMVRMQAHTINRRQNERRAKRLWLTKEQVAEIKQFHAEARRLTKETGIPHQVDHIVPLKGKTVSGLHVPWNLQVITKLANMKKGNR